MADDIAVLGIKIDSTQVEKADSDLDQLTASSKKAEDATGSLSSEAKKAGQAFTSYGVGINDSLKAALKFNKTSKSIENQLAKEIARVKGGEQAYRELAAAQRLGLKSAEQLPPAIRNQIAQLVRLKKEAKEAAAAQRELERSGSSYGNSLDEAGKKQAEFGRRAGQASVQVEQLIGQIASGGNPVQAFAFQVADLGIVLGAPLIGAIAGISASLVNLFLPALLNSKDATNELKESISELIGQAKLEAEELELLANVRDKDNKALADSNKELEQQIKDLTSLNNLRKEAVNNPVTTTDELILQQKFSEQIEDTSQKILELKNQIIANKREIKANNDQVERATKSTGEFEQASAEIIQSLKNQTLALEGNERAVLENALAQSLNLEQGQKLPKNIQDQVNAYLKLKGQIEEQTKLEQEYAEFTKEKNEELKETQQELERYEQRLQSVNISLQSQIAALMGNKEESLELRTAQRLGLESVEDLDDSTKALIATLVKLQKEQKETKKEQKELTKESEDSAKQIERAYERLENTVSSSFERLFRGGLNGFEGFADAAFSIIENMLVKMAAEIATANLLGGLGGSSVGGLGGLLGGLTGAVGAGGSSLGGLGGLLGGAGVLGNFGAGISLTTGALANISTLGFGTAISGLFSNIGTLFSSGSFAAGIGAALPVAGIAALALPLVDTLISSVGNALFGGSFKTQSAGIQFDVTGGSLTAQSFENQRKSGGLFSSSKRRTLLSDLDAETEAQFSATFESISDTVVDGLQILGFDLADNALDAFTSGIEQVKFGEDSAENQAAIQAYFDSLSNEVARFAQGGGAKLNQEIVDLLESGFDLSQIEDLLEDFDISTLERQSLLTFEQIQELSTALNATNAVFEEIGIQAFEASVASAELSQELIGISGGIQAFLANSANFADTFVDTRTNAETLSDVFGELGLALPSSADALVSLVQGLDLTTEEGQKAFAVITSLTNSLSEYYNEQERLAERALQINESIAQRLAAFGLTGVDAQLFNLDAEFDKLRQEAEENGGDLVAIEELYGKLREQILQDEADRLLAIEQELVDRRVELNQSISDRLEEIGLDSFELGLLQLDREFELLRQEAIETGGDLVAIEQLYGELRQEILDEQTQSQLAAEQAAADELLRIEEEAAAEQARIRQENLNNAIATTDSAFTQLSNAVNRQQNLLAETLEEDLEQIELAGASALDSLAASADSATDNINSLSGLLSNINNTIERLTPQTRGAAQSQVQSAIDIARSGGSLAGIDLSRALNTLAEPSEDLFGSFEDYLRDFNLTNNALSELGSLTEGQLTTEEQTLNSINAQVEAVQNDTQLQLEQRQALFDQEFNLLEQQLVDAEKQLNTLRGIDTTILGISDAQDALNSAINAESLILESVNEAIEQVQTGQALLDENISQKLTDSQGLMVEANEVANKSNESLSSISESVVEMIEVIKESPMYELPIVDTGLPIQELPFEVMSSTQPETSNVQTASLENATSSNDVVAILNNISNWITQTAVNTRRTKNLLEGWDGNGLPEERTV